MLVTHVTFRNLYTSLAVLSTIPVPPGPHGVVITPDGRCVYVSSDGASTVSVIDTNTDRVSNSIEVGQTPHGLAITPDGSTVLVAGFGTSQVEAIDKRDMRRAAAEDTVPADLFLTSERGLGYTGPCRAGLAG